MISLVVGIPEVQGEILAFDPAELKQALTKYPDARHPGGGRAREEEAHPSDFFRLLPVRAERSQQYGDDQAQKDPCQGHCVSYPQSADTSIGAPNAAYQPRRPGALSGCMRLFDTRL